MKFIFEVISTPTRPVDNVVIATKGLQDRNTNIIAGTTVENKGKLILNEINNSASILKSVNRKNELITWEKIFIHKHAHHIMNFEVLPVNSFIKKYIWRPPDSASMTPITSRHNARHFSRFELRMAKTLPETIFFREANYLRWRLLIKENYDIKAYLFHLQKLHECHF